MPTALVPIEKLQIGMETVPGTRVAATKVIATEDGGDYTHDITREETGEITGVFVARDDVALVEVAEITVNHVLDFEQVLLPLLSGIKSVTPTGDGPYVWEFEPALSTLETLKSATFEVSYTDGTTRHVEEEFGFGVCRSFEVGLAFNQLATLQAEYFGQAPAASTFTPSLAVPARELLASNKFAVYINDAWADLGDTQISGLVRSASLSVTTGVEPNYTLDGASNLDHTKIRRGMLSAELSLTMEVDAAFATELAKFKAGDLRFYRLAATGSDGRVIQFDVAGRYITSPDYTVDDTMRLADLTLAMRYDPTSAKALRIGVTNGLATF
jgi:hypothetical protein